MALKTKPTGMVDGSASRWFACIKSGVPQEFAPVSYELYSKMLLEFLKIFTYYAIHFSHYKLKYNYVYMGYALLCTNMNALLKYFNKL